MSQIISPVSGSLPITVHETTSGDVAFQEFQRPVTGSGSVSITLKTSDPEPLDAIVQLLQGDRIVSAQAITVTSSPQTVVIGLSEDVINSIFPQPTCKLQNVKVRVIAAAPVVVPCCPTPIPAILHDQMSGPVGDRLTLGWDGSGFSSPWCR